MTHSRPATRPTPVTIPAPGASPSYIPCAASGESSRNGAPLSSSRSTRSRGSSLPREVWRSRARSPPPIRTRASCSRRSATNGSKSLNGRHHLIACHLVPDRHRQRRELPVERGGERELHLHRLQDHDGLAGYHVVALGERHEQHRARHRRAQLTAGVRVVDVLRHRLGHVPRPALVRDPIAREPKGAWPLYLRFEDDVEGLAAVDGELPVGGGALAGEPPAVAAVERVVAG